MRKVFLIFILVLSLAFTGFAENTEKNTEKQSSVRKNSFRVDPTLFCTFLSTVIIRSNWKCGLTIFGVDVTVFKYKNWNFLGVGGGLAAHFSENTNPWFYDPYYYYEDSYYNQGWHYEKYNTEFWTFLKLVIVKYRWDWLSQTLKIKTHVGISITTKKEFVFGLTFSDILKKKK